MTKENDNTKKPKTPAFLFYPKDFLTDSKVLRMSAEIRGLYINLLCVDWIEDGFLKADMMILAGYNYYDQRGNLRDDECYAVAMRLLCDCFIAHASKPGYVTSPRLQQERKNLLDSQDRKREAGKIGANARWIKDLRPMAGASECHSDRIATAMRKNAIPISISISNTSTDQERDSSKGVDPGQGQEAETELSHVPVLNLSGQFELDADARLEKATGSQPWEKSNLFLTTGRRPLKNYPDIYLNTHELAEILRQYTDSGIRSKMREANQLVLAKINNYKAQGRKVENLSVASWYMSWIKNELLESAIKHKRLNKIGEK